MSDPSPSRRLNNGHGVTKPQAQVFNHAAEDGPFAALITAASHVARQGSTDTQMAQLLALRPENYISQIIELPKSSALREALLKPEVQAAMLTSDGPCATGKDNRVVRSNNNSQTDFDAQAGADDAEDLDEPGGPEYSSNDNSAEPADSAALTTKTSPGAMSAEARKKRRQEINRESARRVRKRKSMEHQQLRQQVESLQAAAATAAADHTVIAQYASEVTKERDALVQKVSDLETKWITAECRSIVYRQRISELAGVPLQRISLVDGHLLKQENGEQHR